MILTVTPNPAFDRIQVVPPFNPGQVCRASALSLFPGGKGVNVSRAVRILGGQSLCAGFLGGHTGRMQADYSAREGLAAHWTWVDGETRVSVIVVSPEDDTLPKGAVSGAAGDGRAPSGMLTTVFNEQGPSVTLEDWKRLQADVLQLAANAEAVCLSGSLPAGLPPDIFGDLLQALRRARARVWVDTSGATLRAAMDMRPEVVKINHLEAAALLGWREFQDVSTAAQAAQTIQHNGVSKAILTLGKAGAVLASDAGTWHARPPAIKPLCAIGSGDAFLGGLVMAALADMPDPDAIRQAVAVGTANALTLGGGNFSRQDMEQLLANTSCRKLA